MYAVKMTKNGIPIEVVIDDFIPFKKGKDVPAFTSTKGNEMWVVLAEKAYAKVHGCYDRLRSGWAHDAARDLTGAIGYQHNDYDADDMYEKLKDAQEQNWFAMASCRIKEDGDRAKFKVLGLITSHSYSVLGV